MTQSRVRFRDIESRGPVEKTRFRIDTGPASFAPATRAPTLDTGGKNGLTDVARDWEVQLASASHAAAVPQRLRHTGDGMNA